MYPGRFTVTEPFVGIRPMAPSGPRVTNTAPTTRIALDAGRVARSRTPRLWGAIPVEEVEGHDVDPAYDVRPLEDVRRSPIRSEHLAGLGLVIPSAAALASAASQASQEPEPAPPEPSAFGISTPYLVLAALAAVALGMMLKR